MVLRQQGGYKWGHSEYMIVLHPRVWRRRLKEGKKVAQAKDLRTLVLINGHEVMRGEDTGPSPIQSGASKIQLTVSFSN